MYRIAISLVAALSIFGTSATAQSTICPFAGITTNGYGTGTGVCSQSVLTAALDQTTCSLAFGYAPDPFICGNTYRTQNILMVGTRQLPFPVPIGPPLIPGSTLLIEPLVFLGLFPGAVMELPLPADTRLIGVPFEFQAITGFITTTSFPVVVEYGLSTGLTVTLQ